MNRALIILGNFYIILQAEIYFLVLTVSLSCYWLVKVGEDLSEGEAQVLTEYGWEPNTGLGTMLKYCDRVVHDRKNETDSSEWRSKIGKLLMDGYNGGALIASNIPKKVLECRDVQSPEIKLEL